MTKQDIHAALLRYSNHRIWNWQLWPALVFGFGLSCLLYTAALIMAGWIFSQVGHNPLLFFGYAGMVGLCAVWALWNAHEMRGNARYVTVERLTTDQAIALASLSER